MHRREEEINELEEEYDESIGVINSEEKTNLDNEVALLNSDNKSEDDLAHIFKEQCTNSIDITTEDQVMLLQLCSEMIK